MSSSSQVQNLSMDEILASIRKIISEEPKSTAGAGQMAGGAYAGRNGQPSQPQPAFEAEVAVPAPSHPSASGPSPSQPSHSGVTSHKPGVRPSGPAPTHGRLAAAMAGRTLRPKAVIDDDILELSEDGGRPFALETAAPALAAKPTEAAPAPAPALTAEAPAATAPAARGGHWPAPPATGQPVTGQPVTQPASERMQASVLAASAPEARSSPPLQPLTDFAVDLASERVAAGLAHDRLEAEPAPAAPAAPAGALPMPHTERPRQTFLSMNDLLKRQEWPASKAGEPAAAAARASSSVAVSVQPPAASAPDARPAPLGKPAAAVAAAAPEAAPEVASAPEEKPSGFDVDQASGARARSGLQPGEDKPASASASPEVEVEVEVEAEPEPSSSAQPSAMAQASLRSAPGATPLAASAAAKADGERLAAPEQTSAAEPKAAPAPAPARTEPRTGAELAVKPDVATPAPTPSPAAPMRTLEDTVGELLRPVLRQWLDDNMPRIAEKAFREELASRAGPGGKA